MLTLDPTGAGAEEYLASVSAEAERRYLESPRYSYLVAERDGAIVGFIAMRDKTHLFHLFVEAKVQHQGVARALWNEVRTQVLGELGSCEFTVNASLNAVPVYENFGFAAVGADVRSHGIAFRPMRTRLQNAA